MFRTIIMHLNNYGSLLNIVVLYSQAVSSQKLRFNLCLNIHMYMIYLYQVASIRIVGPRDRNNVVNPLSSIGLYSTVDTPL